MGAGPGRGPSSSTSGHLSRVLSSSRQLEKGPQSLCLRGTDVGTQLSGSQAKAEGRPPELTGTPRVLGWGWGALGRGRDWGGITERNAKLVLLGAQLFVLIPLSAVACSLSQGSTQDSTSCSVAELGRQTLRDAARLPTPTTVHPHPATLAAPGCSKGLQEAEAQTGLLQTYSGPLRG